MLRWAKWGWIVFQKDLRLEFRTLTALNAIILFAVTTLTAVSFAIGPVKLQSTVLAPLLWVILFFSAMSGLAHGFVREEEQQTADTLRLLLPPNAVWIGKWVFNVTLLGILQIIVVPLFLILMSAQVENWPIFLVTQVTGGLALASVSTIIAAIVSLASSRGALFAILTFPISMPILISAIHSTQLAFEGAPFSACMTDIRVLFSFTVIVVTVSVLVFEHVWRP